MICNHLHCTRPRCKCACHRDVFRQPKPAMVANAPAELVPVRSTISQTKAILDVIDQHLPEIVRRANDDTEDGYNPASLGSPVSNGGGPPDLFLRAFKNIGGQTEETARWVEKGDRVKAAYTRLRNNIQTAATLIAEAHDEIARLRAVTTEEARRLLEGDISATCENCSRVVKDTRDDRLRRGLCNACYQYDETHDHEPRPRELWV